MTQPDNLSPASAVNHSSFAAFANTTEQEWLDKMLESLGEPLNAIIGLCNAIMENPFMAGLRLLAQEFLTGVEGIGQQVIGGMQFLFDTLCSIVTCGVYTPGGTTPQTLLAGMNHFFFMFAIDLLRQAWTKFFDAWTGMHWTDPFFVLHTAWKSVVDLILDLINWACTVFYNFTQTFFPDFFAWQMLKDAWNTYYTAVEAIQWDSLHSLWELIDANAEFFCDLVEWGIVVFKNFTNFDLTGLWTAIALHTFWANCDAYAAAIFAINWLDEPAGLMSWIGATIDFFQAQGNWLLNAIADVLAWDVATIHGMFESVINFIDGVVQYYFGDTGLQSWHNALDMFGGLTGSGLVDGMSGIVKFFKDFGAIFDVVDLPFLTDLTGNMASSVTSLNSLFGGSGTTMGSLVEALTSWLSGLQDFVSGLVDAALGGLIEFLTGLFGGSGNTIQELINLITSWITAFLALFNLDFTAGFSGIVAGFQEFLNSLGGAFGVGGITHTFETVVSALTNWTTNLPGIIGPIISVLTGGAGSTITDLQQWVAKLLTTLSPVNAGNLFGTVGSNVLGSLPISHTTNEVVNLLADAAFGAAAVLSGGNGWVWDSLVGHSSAGSAKVVADGTRKVLYSNYVSVTPGNTLTASVWTKWASLSAANTITVGLATYAGQKSKGIVQVATGGVSGSGDWTQLSGQWQVPDGVDTVCLMLGCSAASGTAYFDDASLTKTSTVGSAIGVAGGSGNIIDDIVSTVTSLVTPPSTVGTGQISDAVHNLLLNPIFMTANAFPAGNGWTWDGAVHHTAVGGSARVEADGRKRGFASNVIPVVPGDVIDAWTWVKWTGYSGSGNPIDLVINVFDSAGNLLEEAWVDAVYMPAASGDWQKLGGNNPYTVPASVGGGVPAEICLEFLIAREAETGTIWFDDAGVTKQAVLSGSLINTGNVADAFVSGVTTTVANIVDGLLGWTDPSTYTHDSAQQALTSTAATQTGLGNTLSSTTSTVSGHTGSISGIQTALTGHNTSINNLLSWATGVNSTLASLNATPPSPPGNGGGGTGGSTNTTASDDFERSGSDLGSGWATSYSAGNGYVYCDGHNARWQDVYPCGFRQMIAVYQGTNAISASDYQITSVVLGSAPASDVLGYVGYNRLLGRVNSTGTDYVQFQFGGNGSFKLSYFINSSESVLSSSGAGSITVPGPGSVVELHCGYKGTSGSDPNIYKVVINGSTILNVSFTGPNIGSSYRYRGLGMSANGVPLTAGTMQPGYVNLWTGSDQ